MGESLGFYYFSPKLQASGNRAVAPNALRPCGNRGQVPASRYRWAGEICRNGRIVTGLSSTLSLSRERHGTPNVQLWT
jgi:hypothetical protein